MHVCLLLIMRESEAADAGVAGWEGVQQGKVEGSPDLEISKSYL